MEESLFTSGDASVTGAGANRPYTYDASRLDQVISSAKGFDDMEAFTLSIMGDSDDGEDGKSYLDDMSLNP